MFFGNYHYNYIWAISLQSTLLTSTLIAKKQFTVKGKTYPIFDPNCKVPNVKLQWFPTCVPDDTIGAVLSPFGKVAQITRETWKNDFFTGIESINRSINLKFHEDVTIDKLSYLKSIPVKPYLPSLADLCSVPTGRRLAMSAETSPHLDSRGVMHSDTIAQIVMTFTSPKLTVHEQNLLPLQMLTLISMSLSRMSHSTAQLQYPTYPTDHLGPGTTIPNLIRSC